jgi:putative SOS response-associated peptidase YedK
MCGALERLSSKQLSTEFKANIQIETEFDRIARLAPTMGIPVISSFKPNNLELYSWGLIPSFSKEFKMTYSTFNATSEKLFESGMWNKLIGKKHCVIVCNKFYEWHYEIPEKKKGAHIYEIKTAGSNLTFLAGFWESWKNKETGELKNSCTIITNPANELMTEIHNTKARMPAFLTNENYKFWIDNELPLNQRMELIKPVESNFLEANEIPSIQ